MRAPILSSLWAFTLCASALWIRPDIASRGVSTEPDPFPSKRTVNVARAAPPKVPAFFMGDFPQTPNGDDEKALLADAFPDIYTLVWVALNKFDATVFDRWFPPEDKDKVLGVLRQIIDDPVSRLRM